MRTHRLGVFEGVAELLAVPAACADTSVDAGEAVHHTETAQPRQALLTRHVPGLNLGGSVMDVSSSPSPLLGKVQLPDRWIDEDVFEMPERHTWAHLHAVEVRRVRNETGLSQNKLAERFGVTSPTIRHALEIAERREQAAAGGESGLIADNDDGPNADPAAGQSNADRGSGDAKNDSASA